MADTTLATSTSTQTEWVRAAGNNIFIIVRPDGCYVGMGQIVSNPGWALKFTAEEIIQRYGDAENVPWEKSTP